MHPSTLSALADDHLSPVILSRIEHDTVLLLVEGVWYTPDADELQALLADMAAGHIGGDSSDDELVQILRERVPLMEAP